MHEADYIVFLYAQATAYLKSGIASVSTRFNPLIIRGIIIFFIFIAPFPLRKLLKVL